MATADPCIGTTSPVPILTVPSVGGDQRRDCGKKKQLHEIEINTSQLSINEEMGECMEQAEHVSVMLDRCVSLLAPAIERATNPVVVDATLGLGGHSEALLNRFHTLTVIGIDRDLEALAKANMRLAKFGERFRSSHAVYDQIRDCVEDFGFKKIDGALFDLGISSMQVDQSKRGFSYSNDAPLDMRMDRSQGRSAADLVNFGTRSELIYILRTFGEEKFAPRIVDSIIRQREIAPLNSTVQLAELVKAAIPAATRRTGGNPAKRTFQALRIAVNDELGALTRAIPEAMDLLVIGGRMVVMSFQSLEDKIVKSYFSKACESLTPRELPVELPQFAPKFSLLVKQSETATSEEIAVNSRSQSVRLRAIERVAA